MTVFGQARNWLVSSDPGLLRLRAAGRTTAGLGVALLILDLLTRATGQPLSVALLGAVVAMNSSMAVNEPDSRQRRITMALLPVPAALAITAGALLAPHRIAADVVFVVIIFVAIYARRFGGRGRAFGMVAFMTYFFALFLRARASEVPWLIAAIVIGTVCSFAISTYVLPDKPERVVWRTVASLRARAGMVVATVGAALQAGRLDERRRRRLQGRTARFKEAAVMVQTQLEDLEDLEDRAGPAAPGSGEAGEDLIMRVFDTGLAVERLAGAGGRAAAAAPDIPVAARTQLVAALTYLSAGIGKPRSDGLRQAADLAERLVDQRPAPTAHTAPDIGRLAMAIIATARAVQAVRAVTAPTAAGRTKAGPNAPIPRSGSGGADQAAQHRRGGLRPTTRQAIQGAIAASLAIVAGELVSPARWYWAVIAAFMIFTGTTSWGQTLTKGWQRLLGTVLGVPAGVLVATAASGNATASIALIFVCLFCAFYFMKVAYSLMIFWFTTMLALLYGLLGEFSVGLLLLRIEETAIGAVIGVTAAIVVLPTHTTASVRDDARSFLTTLSDLIEASATTLTGADPTTSPAVMARRLDRELEQFRITAKPLSAGLAGIAGTAGRRSTRRSLRTLSACDYYARTLAQCSTHHGHAVNSATLSGVVTAAAGRTRRNIRVLVDILDGRSPGTVLRATDVLDTADTLARQHGGDPHTRRASPDPGQLHGALRALRQIDCAVVDAATDAGASQAEPLIPKFPPVG